MTELFVLIIELVGEYIPFTYTINCKQKYPLKLVIINSPVLVLKLNGDVVDERSFEPVESYRVQDYKLQ